MADLLAIQGLSAGYGRAVVLSDIGLRLGEGEALAVLGRNGMGKTTLIDSIVGVTRRFAGSLALGGREIGPPSLFRIRSLSLIRARASWAFTVPSATPRTFAVSRIVRPSSSRS